MKHFFFLLFGGMLFSLTTKAQRNVSPALNKQVQELKEVVNKVNQSAKSLQSDTTFSNQYINVMINYTNDSVLKAAESLGAHVGTFRNNRKIGTLRIPLAQFDQVAALKGIKYMDNQKLKPLMNNVRKKSNIDLVIEGIDLPEGITGKGVVIGIVDIGFEYNHLNFYNRRGRNFRIASVWDQNITTSMAPAKYGYGTEYNDMLNILAAEYDYWAKNSKESHGTHVAGIAAGADTTSHYQGVAVDAEIVLVSTTLNDADIANGVDYIINYAKDSQMPCVINISLGNNSGPNDGNSTIEQFIDACADQPGVAIVIAGGNEGRQLIHAEKKFESSNDTLSLGFEKRYLENIINLWGETGKTFEARFCLFDDETGKVVYAGDFVKVGDDPQQIRLNRSLHDLLDSKGMTLDFNLTSSVNPLNNQGNIYCYYNYYPVLKGVSIGLQIVGETGTVNLWSALPNDTNSKNHFTPWDNNQTINSLATGKNTIAVGSYVNQPYVTNIFGQKVYARPDTIAGKLSSFSSNGPTSDYRTKPDITAPGTLVISSFSKSAFSNTTYLNRIVHKHDDSYFGAFSGTSMAAPVVTGIIALWMQIDPTLDHKRIKELLEYSAKRDEETTGLMQLGDQNNNWGYGKIDAWAGAKRLLQMVSSEQTHLLPPLSLRQTGEGRREIELLAMQPLSAFELTLYDSMGIVIMNRTNNSLQQGESMKLKLPQHYPSGIYLLKIYLNGVVTTEKIVIE